jgi:nucleoside-diphosphate-sugar epimerase
MKILVTGAAGFISSHLIERLMKDGHEVVGIDNFDPFYKKELKISNLERLERLGRSKFSFIEMDLTNAKRYESIPKVDIVIHIAAKAGVRPSIEAPNDYVQTNIVGTQNLLDWMVKKGVKKLLFASSSSIYGNNINVPFKETDIVDFPISPYAYSKKSNELQIHTFHKLYDIDAICMRFFTVFGPRQRPDLAIRKFVTKILNDEPIEMFGDGSTGRDYTFVSDTVEGILQSLNYVQNNSNVYEVINLGNSKPVKLNEMIDVIYEITGKEKNIVQKPMQPGDVDLTYADISKASNLIGYQPQISFKQGVEIFVEWLKSEEGL